ncbi:hypothetical protein KUTeg_002146 [Tegillarca granosa]|uniref:Uncharacterized protein n=1 Tax=Tegillarca granosa TaxID=220873 RepID=A0ABQ9FTH9_TEGGR|nr:hypothetical protein KUTeg_002146 [Tegillarca granosa]
MKYKSFSLHYVQKHHSLFYVLGYRVFIHGAAATPIKLVDAMAEHGKKAGLKNVEIFHIHTEGPGTYNKPEFEDKSLIKAQNDNPKDKGLIKAQNDSPKDKGLTETQNGNQKDKGLIKAQNDSPKDNGLFETQNTNQKVKDLMETQNDNPNQRSNGNPE